MNSAANAFSGNFVNSGHRNPIQLSFKSMCNVLKKTFLKSRSISNEILSKFGIRSTPGYQRVTSNVSRTMGSEWPDKRYKTGFGSVTGGGGGGGVIILPSLTVWALGGLSNGTVLPMGSASDSTRNEAHVRSVRYIARGLLTWYPVVG